MVGAHLGSSEVLFRAAPTGNVWELPPHSTWPAARILCPRGTKALFSYLRIDRLCCAIDVSEFLERSGWGLILSESTFLLSFSFSILLSSSHHPPSRFFSACVLFIIPYSTRIFFSSSAFRELDLRQKLRRCILTQQTAQRIKQNNTLRRISEGPINIWKHRNLTS